MFVKFKISELNRTVCISNWTKTNCYYWRYWKRKK